MRIRFPKGKQKEFLQKALDRTNYSLYGISKLRGFSYSVLKRYGREELLLPEDLGNYISEISGIKWQEFNGKPIEDNWGCRKGGIKGYKTLIKLHYKKVMKWRKAKKPWLKFKNQPKKIKIPKLDERLAEFVGIILGDGTLTKYFIRISLDSKNDQNYSNYISNLCFELFGISPQVTKTKNVTNLKISSVILCKFLNKNLSIQFGSKIKNKTIIPKIIFNNLSLMRCCLRGLMDTDGTFGTGLYLSSHNSYLLNQLANFNKRENIFTSFTGYYAGILTRSQIFNYFKTVGSSNLKNIIRFQEMFLKSKPRNYIHNDEVIKLLNQYKNVKLPFIFTGS